MTSGNTMEKGSGYYWIRIKLKFRHGRVS